MRPLSVNAGYKKILLSHPPGVKWEAKNAITVFKAWNIFLSVHIIEEITKHTIIYQRKMSQKCSWESDVRDSNWEEIKALLRLHDRNSQIFISKHTVCTFSWLTQPLLKYFGYFGAALSFIVIMYSEYNQSHHHLFSLQSQ